MKRQPLLNRTMSRLNSELCRHEWERDRHEHVLEEIQASLRLLASDRREAVGKIDELTEQLRRWQSWAAGAKEPPDGQIAGQVVEARGDGTVVLEDGRTIWDPLAGLQYVICRLNEIDRAS